MKKICLINDFLEDTGAGRYGVKLYEHLKNVLQIDYLVFNGDLMSLEIGTGDKKETLYKVSGIPFLNKKPFLWERLSKRIAQYDLYHMATPNLAFLANERQPAIVTCHDIAPLFIPTSPFEKILRRYLYSGLKKAGRIIADSEWTKKDIIRAFGINEDKIRVIPLGVDTQVFKVMDKIECRKRMNLPLNKKIILNVAIEKWRKNIPGLIKAFAIVKEKIPETILVRVGKPIRKTLNLIEDLRLKNSVIYFDGISEEQLVWIYNSADVFAFPSFYEGFGLPCLEAMACGIPVVSSNATSLPEVVGDSGIMIDPYSIDEIAGEISKVLSNSDLHNSLSKKGLQRIGKFQWKNTAIQTEKVYREIM